TGFIGKTCACIYVGSPRIGFLVIDPSGYWDYNVTAANTLTKIGATVGTSIATYAGRVWIGNANVVNFTDINSYNSFGGAGGSLTISDQYLVYGVTCLYAANNYLYIFGAASVDILSNVTVTAGVTSFSRINALQGIGCIYNMTIVGYGRGVAFLDYTGYYLLAGATPERISDRIQAVLRSANWPVAGVPWPSACVFTLNQELCLGLMIPILDTFSGQQPSRSIVLIYQRHRWWVYKPYVQNAGSGQWLVPGPMAGATVAIQGGGSPSLGASWVGCWYVTATVAAFTTFFSAAPNAPWVIRTKLWDGTKAFSEKQAVNVALGGVWTSPLSVATNVTFTVDSELQVSAPQTLPPLTTKEVGAYGYALDVLYGVMAANQSYGSQFIGLTFNGSQNVLGPTLAYPSPVSLLAMRGKQERNMLE
ncbi:MAG: hypothetical protein HRJ53_07330, partial [Acidobacteria bacterium Pan2503]|nr:hypothetical protein [Candidatus Acidoferrum panamensis]